MPANQTPISSRSAPKEAFENERLAAKSMNEAAAKMHPVTEGITKPLRRIGEQATKKMKSGGRTKKGC